jgi:hypothetical protein
VAHDTALIGGLLATPGSTVAVVVLAVVPAVVLVVAVIVVVMVRVVLTENVEEGEVKATEADQTAQLGVAVLHRMTGLATDQPPRCVCLMRQEPAANSHAPLVADADEWYVAVPAASAASAVRRWQRGAAAGPQPD